MISNKTKEAAQKLTEAEELKAKLDRMYEQMIAVGIENWEPTQAQKIIQVRAQVYTDVERCRELLKKRQQMARQVSRKGAE